MKSFKYEIKEDVGIHARPASLLVKEATSYASSITIECGDKKADVKRMLALMALGVKFGEEVTFFIEGDDEDIAAAKLEAFCSSNL